jgi:biopolymer transport protein TolR
MAEINVTPLVDVMLVLLIIFMVAAPMLQQGVEVNLPKATNAPLAGSAEQLVISIDTAGTIFLGSGNKVTVPEVGAKVSAALASRPENEKKVYIKADAGLQYSVLMDVMSSLHQSGITQIGLVSAPRGDGK